MIHILICVKNQSFQGFENGYFGPFLAEVLTSSLGPIRRTLGMAV